MAQNTKAVEIFESIKSAVIKLDNVFDRNLTLAHVFQHTYIKRLQSKTFKAELQQKATWEMINADELKKVIAELPFSDNLDQMFSAKQWIALYMITVKHPMAKDSSKDMIALAKWADERVHFAKLQLPTVKANKNTGGSNTGKGI